MSSEEIRTNYRKSMEKDIFSALSVFRALFTDEEFSDLCTNINKFLVEHTNG